MSKPLRKGKNPLWKNALRRQLNPELAWRDRFMYGLQIKEIFSIKQFNALTPEQKIATFDLMNHFTPPEAEKFINNVRRLPPNEKIRRILDKYMNTFKTYKLQYPD